MGWRGKEGVMLVSKEMWAGKQTIYHEIKNHPKGRPG